MPPDERGRSLAQARHRPTCTERQSEPTSLQCDIGPAFSETALAAYADSLHVALGAGSGANTIAPATRMAEPKSDDLTIVVAGAHLSGMALSHELTSLDARCVTTAKTAPGYKLFALATTPPKPGLVRSPDFPGPGIEMEVRSLTPGNFDRFIGALPEPLGIGKVTLADGSLHPGFICEAYALSGAIDITGYGGWRAYRASLA